MPDRIPDFQTLMLPFLKYTSGGQLHNIHDIHDALCIEFKLTDAEKEMMLPSGNQPVMRNRVGWARTYLKKAGLITSPQRAHFKISEAGEQLLNTNPARIDIKLLQTLPAFQEWQNQTGSKEGAADAGADTVEIETSKTPEELLDYSYVKLRDELAGELLEKVKSCSPAFFEHLVIELLLNMGYGGSRREAGQVMGRSGDGGIDGLIKEDKLGLDTIYVQAKRWGATVTIHQVRDFAGSLLAQKARKGIFLTTSSFPPSAKDYVSSIEPKIVLIDGKELAALMIEYNVGVAVKKNYEIKKIDLDYFEEE